MTAVDDDVGGKFRLGVDDNKEIRAGIDVEPPPMCPRQEGVFPATGNPMRHLTLNSKF